MTKPFAYRAPAETDPHARTWMCWPSDPSGYGGPGAYYENVQETISRLAAAIAVYEPVAMLAGAEHHALASKLCGPRVELIDIETDDMWARDTGPVFVKKDGGGLAAVDFNFNGWGAKAPCALDALVARAVVKQADCERIETTLIGEGGGLEYDGEGTLVLTDSCWVNDNRNPGKSRDEIEHELSRLLGVEKVIWLPGIAGADITDDHIDGIFRFVRPGLAVLSLPNNDGGDYDAHHAELRSLLNRATDARGRKIEVVEIPYAEDVRSEHPDFFSGYANYYVANGVIITPQFGDKYADAHALTTFERLFPDRKIVALDLDRIYENGGGAHCVTQQEPA
ncbi:MAG: agmatine deiminase family protein [Parvularculaceae bacterium]